MLNQIINKNDYVRIAGVIYSHELKHFIIVSGFVVSVTKIDKCVLSGFSLSSKTFDFIFKNIEKIIFNEDNQAKIKVLEPIDKVSVLREKLNNNTLSIQQIKQIKKDIKRIIK